MQRRNPNCVLKANLDFDLRILSLPEERDGGEDRDLYEV